LKSKRNGEMKTSKRCDACGDFCDSEGNGLTTMFYNGNLFKCCCVCAKLSSNCKQLNYFLLTNLKTIDQLDVSEIWIRKLTSPLVE